MLDLHSHVLPGLDDGAPDMEQALAMCRLALDDGVRLMAATPHWYPARDPLTMGEISRAVGALRVALASAGLPLELVAGAEVALDPDLPRLAKEGVLPTLGGGPYFLLECPLHTSPRLLPDLIYSLRLAGLRPILAHAERTWAGTENWDWLQGLVGQGCLVQVTAASLTGKLGSAPRKTAEALLSLGLVNLLASDAHSVNWRPPGLSQAAAVAERLCEAGAAEVLTRLTPQAVLAGEEPPPAPQPARRRGLFFWRK
ncbi:MAG: hypothetical protein KMY53_12310 [Desulfarculus sp.]|nr:capsular biosynthesis protein [Pseudomonadota bacterium]MBV1716781.1 hypothetical protein [Desulfarculus sp.]MBU4573031.1 capsular biosynthesis protein [Pseudomonadota bacterium]MBU4596556.1 capsular biosynthesis protein [Pseudomonadota bacterium]MBV1738942.1 hypothetical protein [Desulfarculus sp.]